MLPCSKCGYYSCKHHICVAEIDPAAQCMCHVLLTTIMLMKVKLRGKGFCNNTAASCIPSYHCNCGIVAAEELVLCMGLGLNLTRRSLTSSRCLEHAESDGGAYSEL